MRGFARLDGCFILGIEGLGGNRKKSKKEAEEFSFTGDIELGIEPLSMVFDRPRRNPKPLCNCPHCFDP